MESAEGGRCESYGQVLPPICGQAVYQRPTVRSHLFARSLCCLYMFQIHLRGPLYGCTLFLLFLIKRKYCRLSDLLIGAIEKFMGCVFLIENAFKLG